MGCKKDANYARYSLCSCDLKYSTQRFQTFTQHSVVKKHEDVSEIRFGENKTQKAVFSTSLSKPQPSLTLDVPLQSKVSSAEAMWAFKLQKRVLHWEIVIILHCLLRICPLSQPMDQILTKSFGEI